MATTVIAETKSAKPSAEEMLQLWIDFKADMNNQDLRNRLVENYLPLVKYNGERIWARLPEGVELDDLISADVGAPSELDHRRGVHHARAGCGEVVLLVPAAGHVVLEESTELAGPVVAREQRDHRHARHGRWEVVANHLRELVRFALQALP